MSDRRSERMAPPPEPPSVTRFILDQLHEAEVDCPLVLVGDGSYQMTGWELIHAPRWGVHPIVLVMNDASWEMLESFLPSRSNALPRVAFAEMARTWGIYGRRVGTPRDLRLALAEARAQSGAALIELTLERRDISATLATFTRSVGTTALPSP